MEQAIPTIIYLISVYGLYCFFCGNSTNIPIINKQEKEMSKLILENCVIAMNEAEELSIVMFGPHNYYSDSELLNDVLGGDLSLYDYDEVRTVDGDELEIGVYIAHVVLAWDQDGILEDIHISNVRPLYSEVLSNESIVNDEAIHKHTYLNSMRTNVLNEQDPELRKKLIVERAAFGDKHNIDVR